MGARIIHYIKDCISAGAETWRVFGVIVGALTTIFAGAAWLLFGTWVAPTFVVGLSQLWVFVIMAPYQIWKRNSARPSLPFEVQVAGDVVSHYPSWDENSNVIRVTLRIAVLNISNEPIRNLGARLEAIEPRGDGVDAPAIGHQLVLPRALSDVDDMFSQFDLPIGARAEFGVCASRRDAPQFIAKAKKFPTSFPNGVLRLNEPYDFTVQISCDRAGCRAVVRAEVSKERWDRPSFHLISVSQISASEAA